MQETVLKINLTNLKNNAVQFKKLTDRFLYAVVKADAYGHGSVAVANALYPIADGFAVALLSEAIAIKGAAGEKEILIFTPPTDEEDVLIAANNGFSLTATDVRSANLIVNAAKKYSLSVVAQIKVNTGMNRYGTYGANLGKVCAILKRSGQVRVQGVYSHLYSHDVDLCEMQRLRFWKGVRICRSYFPLARAHLASTYGATLGNEYLFDGVRIGLGLYGYFPEENSPLPLQPVMQAHAVCVAKRKCLFGGAGYGAERKEFVGEMLSTVRCGYAEGLGLFSEKSGLKPPFIGNFCMDVGICTTAIEQGKSVELFSDARSVARARGTSVYEVLCLAAARARRIYFYE